MNPRIQVEHTVTEMVTGIDIVKSQIHIAEGYPLASPEIGIRDQARRQRCAATPSSAASPPRIPTNNFIPDYGRITALPLGRRLRHPPRRRHRLLRRRHHALLRLAAGQGLRLGPAPSRRPAARWTARWPSGACAACARTCPSCATSSTTRCSAPARPPPPSSTTRPSCSSSRSASTAPARSCSSSATSASTATPRSRAPAPEQAAQAGGPRPRSRRRRRPPGTRDLWKKLGTEDFCAWVRDSKKLLITDTTFRDAHQSLLATRLRTYDMTRVAPAVAQHLSGLFSLEMWGGATFDVAMRFLHEDPWERLALLRRQIPNILFQMLLRGANAVGYTNYPDNVVRRFVERGRHAPASTSSASSTRSTGCPASCRRWRWCASAGAIAEASICYTGNIDDPKRVQVRPAVLRRPGQAAREGRAPTSWASRTCRACCAPSPPAAWSRPCATRWACPSTCTPTTPPASRPARYLFAAEAGVNVVDCAFGAMSSLTSQPNLETIVAALEHQERDTGLALRPAARLHLLLGRGPQLLRRLRERPQGPLGRRLHPRDPGRPVLATCAPRPSRWAWATASPSSSACTPWSTRCWATSSRSPPRRRWWATWRCSC